MSIIPGFNLPIYSNIIIIIIVALFYVPYDACLTLGLLDWTLFCMGGWGGGGGQVPFYFCTYTICILSEKFLVLCVVTSSLISQTLNFEGQKIKSKQKVSQGLHKFQRCLCVLDVSLCTLFCFMNLIMVCTSLVSTSPSEIKEHFLHWHMLPDVLESLVLDS